MQNKYILTVALITRKKTFKIKADIQILNHLKIKFYIVSERETLTDQVMEMVLYLSSYVQDKICHTLSVRCMVHEAAIREILCRDELKGVLEANIVETMNYFPTNAAENEEYCEKVIERLSGNLKDFETKVLEKFQTIWKIGFEINGVFGQVKLPVDRSIPTLSSGVREKILE